MYKLPGHEIILFLHVNSKETIIKEIIEFSYYIMTKHRTSIYTNNAIYLGYQVFSSQTRIHASEK